MSWEGGETQEKKTTEYKLVAIYKILGNSVNAISFGVLLNQITILNREKISQKEKNGT